MPNAQLLWNKLDSPHLDKAAWQAWLNPYGADGTRVDTEDNVSFINRPLGKAVKISVNPEDRHELSHWESRFGDEESGIIRVLNIACGKPSEAVQAQVNQLIDTWLQAE